MFFQNDRIAPAQLQVGLSPDRVRQIWKIQYEYFHKYSQTAIPCIGVAGNEHSQAKESCTLYFRNRRVTVFYLCLALPCLPSGPFPF